MSNQDTPSGIIWYGEAKGSKVILVYVQPSAEICAVVTSAGQSLQEVQRGLGCARTLMAV